MNRSESGFITLTSVIILAAIGTAIVTSVLLLSVSSTRNAFAEQQSYQARALADACGEEALQQIWNLNSFTGTNTITLGQGSCTYTVTNTGGTTRKITASGTVGTIVRKIQISLSAVNPNITVSSWQEVADFT